MEMTTDTKVNVGEKHKILIVDDEAISTRILKTLIGNTYELRTAASGNDALQIMEEFTADLILLDIVMSGIDGYETCRRLRENPKYSMTRIILVSGNGMTEDKLKGYKVGADDFITKPFIPEELLAKVRVFLKLLEVEHKLRDLNASLEEKVHVRTDQLRQQSGTLVASAKMAALGEMAAGVAHEINNPLSIIVSRVDLLSRAIESGRGDAEKMKSGLEQIKSTALMITKIIAGLRSVSRQSDNDPMEKVKVATVVENALVLCRDRFKLAGVELKVDFGTNGDAEIECRATQLSQVLINLLGNALDAVLLLPQKWVAVKVHCGQGGAVISVTDSGFGIPDQVLAKMMDAFYTTKPVGKGTGLGLSISKNIIQEHQGQLYYDRNSVNTCFVIKIPLTQSRVGDPN